MKTIAQQLNIKEFPFEIKDKEDNIIYFEDSNRYCLRSEYKDNERVYFEDSEGRIIDDRPKEETEMTIAQQLNVKDFPFQIKDKDCKRVYYEDSNGYWCKNEFKDGKEVYFENSYGFWYKKEWKDGNVIYYENSEGRIRDNRPKERPCVGKKVTIDGVEYELK